MAKQNDLIMVTFAAIEYLKLNTSFLPSSSLNITRLKLRITLFNLLSIISFTFFLAIMDENWEHDDQKSWDFQNVSKELWQFQRRQQKVLRLFVAGVVLIFVYFLSVSVSISWRQDDSHPVTTTAPEHVVGSVEKEKEALGLLEVIRALYEPIKLSPTTVCLASYLYLPSFEGSSRCRGLSQESAYCIIIPTQRQLLGCWQLINQSTFLNTDSLNSLPGLIMKSTASSSRCPSETTIHGHSLWASELCS